MIFLNFYVLLGYKIFVNADYKSGERIGRFIFMIELKNIQISHQNHIPLLEAKAALEAVLFEGPSVCTYVFQYALDIICNVYQFQKYP